MKTPPPTPDCGVHHTAEQLAAHGKAEYERGLLDAMNAARASGKTGQEGMTLRDHFAGQVIGALVGLDWSFLNGTNKEITEAWGRSAYEIADVLLEARK